MKKKILGFLYFVIMIITIILVLKIINWIPVALQKGLIRKYSTLDDVKSKLSIKEVYIPSYFTENFSWPPSEILAQSKPFQAVAMEFRHARNKEVALVITQASVEWFNPDRKITISQIKERVDYNLKGRNAVLEIGFCKKNEPCSRMSWKEGNYYVNVLMKAEPIDLIKISESIIR